MSRRWGARLQRLRGNAGLTQQQLADLAGVSVAALRDLEQGRVSSPRSATLRRLSDALRLPVVEAEELMRYGQPGQLPADDLWLQVLGPVAVKVGGKVATVGSRPQRLLLGMLALSANTPVTQDRLIETIWGPVPPANVADLLQNKASRLRRRLPRQRADSGASVLVATAGGYQLTLAEDQLDLSLFRRLVDHARRLLQDGEAVDGYQLLTEAMALWRGDPVVDLAPLRRHPAVALLSRELHSAVVEYAGTASSLGYHNEVLPLLRRVVAADPWNEAACAQLMTALAAGGQRAAALSLFHNLRRRLAEEFGTDPGPELVGAYDAAQRPDAGSPEPPAIPARRRLPADLPELIGRAAELQMMHEATGTGGTAVVAITGLGGMGKTRLAVHFARQLVAAGHFPDTQLHVDLRGSADEAPAQPAAVLAALLRLLGVPPAQIPPDLAGRAGLYRYRLATRRALVLLDDAVDEDQVRPLLPAGAGNLALVTSRRVLALDGGLVVPLSGLPPADTVRLLATIAGPARVTDPAAAARVGELCGNLPLAVSLVARRLQARTGWPLSELVSRLEGAPDRLRELAAGSDQLHSVLDRSYRPLGAAERRLFRLLCRRPEVTAGEAAALAGLPLEDTHRLLDRLVDAHLVATVAGERYRLPDLLRGYERTLPPLAPIPGWRGSSVPPDRP